MVLARYWDIYNEDDEKWVSTKLNAKTTPKGNYAITELKDDVANIRKYTYLGFSSWAPIEGIYVKANTSAKKRPIRRK